jgi:undecaprenyl pyrophosphate phosphatase UppP
VADAGGLGWELFAGFAISAITGYLAIAFLLSVIGKVGLLPFSVYCLLVGVVTVTVL